VSFAPIDYYDGIWNANEERPVLQREDKAIDSIGTHVRGRDHFKLLDVGCGDGSFLKKLDERLDTRGDLHGVDFSKYCLEAAAALPYTFRQCNLEEQIPYEGGGFDVVYSGEVIEHVYNPDHMLEECRRLLKPNGILVLSTPNMHAWYNRMMFVLGTQPLFYEVSTKSALIGAGPLRRVKRQQAPVGHLRLFNRCGLVDLLRNEHFEVVNVSGAVFSALPRPIRRIDRMFNLTPSLASILVVTSRKR
jgi:SAM-dependent methyltransferase